MEKDQIEYLGKLTKIELSEQEKEKFFKQLKKIIEYMAILKEADVEDVKEVEPSKYVDFSQLREDVYQPQCEDDKEEQKKRIHYLHIKGGYFSSPRVVL